MAAIVRVTARADLSARTAAADLELRLTAVAELDDGRLVSTPRGEPIMLTLPSRLPSGTYERASEGEVPAPADGVPWPAQLFGTVVSAEAAPLLALLCERLARAGALPADGTARCRPPGARAGRGRPKRARMSGPRSGPRPAVNAAGAITRQRSASSTGAFMTRMHADAMITAALWLMAMLALIPRSGRLWAVLTRRCEVSWSVAGTRLVRRRL